MNTHALTVFFSFSILFLISPVSELSGQNVQTGDFFEGRKSISGIVANPLGNRPVEVEAEQSWELVQQDRVCCGKTTTLPLHARSTALDEETQKEIQALLGSQFPGRSLTAANTVEAIARRIDRTDLRWNGKDDLPFPEELLKWKTEDPDKKSGLLSFFLEEKKSYQAPPCDCLNITRYQLRTDYTFKGGNLPKEVKISHYSHIYHEATTITDGDCPKEAICNALKRGLRAIPKNFPRDADTDSEVVYRPRGTGRTTGHIATLSVNNPTDDILFLRIEPFYIPSSGRYQSYVSTTKDVIEIRPGATKDIPIMGVCTDIRKPPVPSGEAAFPEISAWIPYSEAGPVLEPSRVYDPATGGFVQRPPEQLTFDPRAGTYLPKPEHMDKAGPAITYPGTDIPFPLTIDPARDYKEVARMIIEAVLRIDSTYENQSRKGTIQTPFSGQSARQSEAVRQQLTWMYVAGMTDDPYEKEDFKEQIVQQYESNTNQSFESAPPAAKENIAKGVDQFWGAFELVGVEAKVLSADKKTASTLSRPGQASNTRKTCVELPKDPQINPRTGFDLMGDLYRKGLVDKDLVNDSRFRLRNETVLRAEAMLSGLNDALSSDLNPIPCQTNELAHTDRPQQFPEFPSDEIYLLVDLCADNTGEDHLSDFLAPGAVDVLNNWYADMEKALMNMGLSPAIDQSMIGFFDQKIKREMDRIADAYNEFESKVLAGMELRYNRSRAEAKMWEGITFVAATAISAATGGTAGALLGVFVSTTGFVFDQGLQSMGADPRVASLVSSLITLSMSMSNAMLTSGAVEGIEETVVGGLLDLSINEQARVLTEKRVKGYALAMNMLNDENWANFVKKLSEDYDAAAIAMWNKNREDLKAEVARSVAELCKIRNSLNRLVDETKKAQERTANWMHSNHWKTLWQQNISDNFDCCCEYSDGTGPDDGCIVRIPGK